MQNIFLQKRKCKKDEKYLCKSLQFQKNGLTLHHRSNEAEGETGKQMAKMTKAQQQKYCGSALVGIELLTAITKEEWAAIAFYLASRLSEHPIEEIKDEYNALIDAQIINKKTFQQ